MYQRIFWVVKIHMLFLVGAMKCQFIRAPVKTWDILFGHPTNSRSSKVNAMLFTIPIKKLDFDHPKVIFKCKSMWFSCQSSIQPLFFMLGHLFASPWLDPSRHPDDLGMSEAYGPVGQVIGIQGYLFSFPKITTCHIWHTRSKHPMLWGGDYLPFKDLQRSYHPNL